MGIDWLVGIGEREKEGKKGGGKGGGRESKKKREEAAETHTPVDNHFSLAALASMRARVSSSCARFSESSVSRSISLYWYRVRGVSEKGGGSAKRKKEKQTERENTHSHTHSLSLRSAKI